MMPWTEQTRRFAQRLNRLISASDLPAAPPAHRPLRPVTPLNDRTPTGTLTTAEFAALNDAYTALNRLGVDTARGGEWNFYLDRAHHDLGLLLAWISAGHIQVSRPGNFPEEHEL